MSARDRNTRRCADLLTSFENLAHGRGGNFVDRHPQNGQRHDRRGAHRIDVGDGVGRSNPAEIVRIVDHRHEEIGGRNDAGFVVELPNCGVIAGFSADQELPIGRHSRLVGEVIKAKSARKLHRNGELRVIFEHIETSDEGVQALAQVQRELQAQAERSQTAAERSQVQTQAQSQAMIGNLEGVEVDRRANIQLDEEGGARTTDSKTRYLSTGLAVMLAAAASHTEAERGTTETAGPGVRTAAGGSGFRLTGALLSLVAKSTPVSVAIGAYGASTSIYANFISRGHDVILPKDTPLEIGFGPPHTKPQ